MSAKLLVCVSLRSTEEALVWIGLTKAKTESWLWNNAEGVSYENWEPGDGTDDGCVAVTFREPYYWSIKPCTLRLPFLCQYQEEGRSVSANFNYLSRPANKKTL